MKGQHSQRKRTYEIARIACSSACAAILAGSVHVSFGFSKVTIQTTVQKSDGSLGSSVTVTYDLSTKVVS